MEKKTKKLLIILTVLAAVAIVFGVAYSGIMGDRLQQYVQKITKCSFLNEDQCREHPQCMPVFEPTPDGQINEFSDCKYRVAGEPVKTNENQIICEQTGGQWQDLRYGSYCNCKVGSNALNFVVGKGCVVQ